MSASAQALNYEIIDDLCGILGDGYEEIVDEQVTQALIYIEQLDRLLAEGDFKTACRRAHALKSSAGQVGLQGIELMAKELEKICLEEHASEAQCERAKNILLHIGKEFSGAVLVLRDYTKKACGKVS